MCLGCFQDVRWCREKKSNPLRSIEKVFRWNRLKHHLNSQTPSSSPKLLLGQRMPRARGRSWGWEPCVCRKSTERSWDSTCNKVLACGPRPLQSPHSQNPRHSKGKTSTTWCTIVFVAATVPTAQDMARSIRSVSCVALMDLLETTIDQLETTVWDSGPMGAQSMLLDILDSIQIGNHGLLVPTNLWLALDWLDSDLFQGSNWPLFLQISILQGAIAVNGLELHDSFCCCSWGWLGDEATSESFAVWDCTIRPTLLPAWNLIASIINTWMHCISCTSRILQPWYQQTSE